MATLLNSVTGKYFKAGADQAVWDDTVVSIIMANIPGAGNPDLDTFNGSLKVISFPPTTETSIYFSIQLSHRWLEASTIKPHLHYLNDATAEAKAAKFTFGYMWMPRSGAITPLETTDPKTTPSLDTAYYCNTLNFTDISGAGKGISSCILCRLTRNGTDPADNFTGDVWGISFDFHIQYDKSWSREYNAV